MRAEMDERTPLIAGNWKMHKTRAEAFDYAREVADAIGDLDAVDIAVCPPFTALDVVETCVTRSARPFVSIASCLTSGTFSMATFMMICSLLRGRGR